MTLTTIPLRSLRLSPLNARSVKPKRIGSLAADIATHGVLQNLIGYEADAKVMICAGGRRYRALKRLQKDKTITPSYKVPVDLRPIEEALELSLAENEQREAMHPADRILAYRALVEGGMVAEDIAVRFGVSIDHVRRLLRMSGLNPKLMNAMKRGELSVASAQALALCEDHAQQWQAFKHVGDNPHSLRRLLTNEKLSCQWALFQLVGEESYTKAGGTITRDLFSSDDESFADDLALVHSLADIRLEELADIERAEGWGAVIASVERPEDFYSLPKLYPDCERGLSDGERARLQSIQDQIAAFEDEGVPHYDERIRNLECEQREIEATCRFHSDLQKAAAKLFLFVGYQGVECHPVGKPKAKKDDLNGAKPKPDYPASLVADLGTIRTYAVREAVANNPDLALDLLLDHMVGQLVGDAYSFEQALEVRACDHVVEPKPELIEGSLLEPVDTLIGDLLPKLQGDDRATTIEEMSGEEKARLLAFCVASQITSSDITGAKGEAIGAIAEKAGVDLPTAWTPSAAFFARLTKPVMLKLIGEHCGEDAALNCKRLRKGELAETCADRLAEASYYPPFLLTEDNTPPWEIENVTSERVVAE